MASFPAPHLHRLLPNLNADLLLLPWRSKAPRLSPSPYPGCFATLASSRASIRGKFSRVLHSFPPSSNSLRFALIRCEAWFDSASSTNGRAPTFDSEAATEQPRSGLVGLSHLVSEFGALRSLIFGLGELVVVGLVFDL